MFFHKKISFIFLISFVFVLVIASFFKLNVHSLTKISLVSTVYAEWWDDFGVETEDTGDEGGGEETDPGRDNWWDDNNDGNDGNDDGDNENNNQCNEESWTDEETSGEFYCNDGKACYKQWSRDSECNIHSDGEDCQNDSRCQQENEQDNNSSCDYKYKYPECQADGQVYEVWQDCNGDWDPRPTGQSCGGGEEEDQEESQGACGENQYWSTSSGQCEVNELEQTKINDEIYCREQCNNSCTGGLGHMRCTEPDGSYKYDCTNPLNQADLAECQNVVEEEFQHIGIDPDPAGAGDLAVPLCTTSKVDGGECNGSEYCSLEAQYCQGEITGNPVRSNNCNLVPNKCGVAADENGKLYIERAACNPECGENETCRDDGNGAGFCQANTEEQAPITVVDSEHNIRVEGNTLRIGEGTAGVSDCQNISDYQEKHNCLVEYAKSHIEDFTGKTASSLQSGPSDTTCQAQNSTSHYCDGNVCIEKSSGWDGNACVDVYKTVSQSNCNNSCSSDIPQSGQDIKLLSCLDETDSTKRSECNQENARIVQTGQRLDQSSLIKASLEISDCESLEGEAKEACQNKNQETRFLGRVLDTVRLENCSNQSGDEKAACDKRNTDAIRAGQIRLNLGIEDCSTLTGDKKTNCEFTNYRRDQITQAVISFKAEDCSVYQTDEEKTKCLENNQKGLSQAVSNSSPFVGLAEVGASCVYTEACAEGGKKACAGKVASDNGAPVCRYDAGAASCSACTTGALDLTNKENKCSEDGQTCLNAPGYACVSDAQCQARLAAAQQAAANAPIDSAKYFSQQFEEGASCKQVQTCDDGTEQVCEGKGANGVCDLSLGGGICSPCQAKGTITLNKVATCNAENKCEGAPALSGCMNDEQCKPVVTRVATGSQVTGYSNVPTGGTVGNDGFIYQTIKQCDTQVQFTPRVNQADDSNADDARFFQIYDNEKSNLDQCVDKIVNTGQRAQPIVVTTYTDKYIAATFEQQSASRQAITATNQLDNFYAQNVLLDPRQNPQEVAQDLAALQLQQKQSLDRLLQAQANLNSISLQPTTNLAAVLDRSTLDQKVAAGNTIVEVQDQDRKVQVSLYQTAQARAQYNQFAEADPFSAEANQAYLDFEAKRQQTISNIDQLASLRGEIGEKTVAPYRQQLDQLPTKADEQFKDQKTVSETNQLSNLARQSNSPEVIMAAQNALTNRVEETERRGNVQLAANLQRQGVQASFEGWLNVYASELSKPGGDSEKGGTSNTQLQIQNLIEVASASDPQVVQKMEQEYAALPNFVAALNLANEIKRETVGTFAGTVTQDNNSAFYSAIANAEEQAKSREDLANLVDRTCALSAQRCTNLQIALGITTPNATADQIADAVVSNSQSDAARAANLLVEQSRLLPQLYQVERSGDANNIEQLSSLLGRSNQIKAELAQIDPNLALRAQAQVQEVIAQGKAQNQLDYATNTYANNKELLLAFDKASRNDIGGLNGVDPVAEAEAARARMQSAIDQMRSVNPEKADALQNDLDLTKFKLESFERGNAMVNSDGCVIEACQGNGSSAQNICTGQVAESKSFNRICAAKNGVVNPGEAAQLELAANLQSVAQPAKVVNENQLTLNSLWQGAVTLPSTIGSMFTDWRARATEGSIPVFIGTPEEQLACRDLWQNTRVQGAQQIQRGESSLGCTIDSRSSEEKALQAAQIANNGGTVKDIFSSLEGVKAESELRQRTLQRAAEEAGVSLDTPMAYWTPTQRDKFYEKLKGLDNAGSIDVFDAIIFPTAALSEVQSAMERCTKDWGKDLCQLDSNLASTYQGIAQADGPIYDQAIKNAKVLNPGIADVPQSDFAWVVDGISKQQRGGVIDLLTAGSVPTRDQFESDDAYYRAITADLAEKGGTGLTREQLINRLLLDANRQGITSADGSAMSREDIANAVDAYLAIGDFGRNVVNTSEAYQWQRAATTEFNWQLAQDVVGLATIAGPLEMLDPTNPIVELAIKGVTKSVSVPARAVTGVFDNVLERIGTNTAKNVLEETAGYGLSRVESNAVAAFYDGRVAGKTVSQSIAELSPSQQLAFGQATDKIGTRLGLTETPDHLIASTVLDTILTQKVDPAQIASQVVRQTDIDALAAQMQKRIETPPFEGAEAVRARIIDGQVEGVRLGQATDEENAAINHLLKTSPSDNPVEKWRNLTPPQQQDIVQQAAREMEIARAVAQREAELTPTNGNQALIQLAEQSKAVSAGNTSPALTNALTSASVVLPKVAEVVVKMADGTPLNALDRRALELAGVSESSLRKNIDPLNQTAKLKVASVVTADPAVLAKTDLETTLLNQGLTSHQASMLATSLQPLAPTPPAPAAQPGFLARLADTWNTLTGRNSTPVSQTIPNTNTVANTNTNQTPPQTTATFSVNDSGSAAFENRRGGQGRPAYPRQDRDVVQTQFRGNENEGLFAVFDGHGTNADQLAQNLTDKLPLKIKDKLSKGKSVEEALIETFKEMNEELPKDLAIRAGSTGTVVYRNGNDVWIVNVGDSPALLSRNGQVESVYTAHSGVAIGPDPDDPNRVSRVAVDRAFGDKGHTAISTGKEISSEITVADVRKITPTSQDEFIVITSDGVFESDMTEQEAIDIVRSQLQAGKSPQEAAQALAKAAYDQGNTDDITVIVIPLHKAPTAPVPPVAPAAPAVVTPPVQAPTSASTTSPSWWERATSWFRSEPTPTDIDQVVVDRSVIVQKRQLAEAALSTEQAVSEALTQQRKAFNEESQALQSAKAEVERTVGLYNEVNKRGLLGLKAPDPVKVRAAEKAADDAEAELEKLIQNSQTALLQDRDQKIKVARLTIEAGNLTAEQIQTDLRAAQEALKTAVAAEKDAVKATNPDGNLTKALNRARQEYAKTYNNLTSGRPPSLEKELEFLQAWKNYQTALEGAGGKETAAVTLARQNLKIDSVSLSTSQAEDLVSKINGLNEASTQYNAKLYQLEDIETDKAVANEQIATLKSLLSDSKSVETLNTQINDYVLKDLVGPEITTFSSPRPWFLFGGNPTAQVQLYVDKAGGLVTPGVAIPSDAIQVVGVFKKTGNKIVLDHYVVPASISEQSFVFQQLNRTANPGWFSKGVQIEKDGTRFTQLYDAAESPALASRVSAPVVDPNLSYKIDLTPDLTNAALQLRLAGDNGELPENTKVLAWLKSIDRGVDQVDTTDARLVVIGFNDGRQPLALDTYEVKALIKQPNLAVEASPQQTLPVSQTVPNTVQVTSNIPETPASLSETEKLYFDALALEKYIEDAHQVLFHSTNQSEIAVVRDALGLPENYSEAEYFAILNLAQDERLQAGQGLSDESILQVKIALGDYLPRDISPVSVSTSPIVAVTTPINDVLDDTARIASDLGVEASGIGLRSDQMVDLANRVAAERRRLENIPLGPGLFAGAPSGKVITLMEERLQLSPEIGRVFDAHGIIKGAGEVDQLDTLDRLLTQGIDPNRTFHSLPLRETDEIEQMAAAAMGSAGPYDSGAFIVISHPGMSIREGIAGVIVNEHYYPFIDELQTAYPSVKFIKAGEMSTELPKIIAIGGDILPTSPSTVQVVTEAISQSVADVIDSAASEVDRLAAAATGARWVGVSQERGEQALLSIREEQTELLIEIQQMENAFYKRAEVVAPQDLSEIRFGLLDDDPELKTYLSELHSLRTRLRYVEAQIEVIEDLGFVDQYLLQEQMLMKGDIQGTPEEIQSAYKMRKKAQMYGPGYEQVADELDASFEAAIQPSFINSIPGVGIVNDITNIVQDSANMVESARGELSQFVERLQPSAPAPKEVLDEALRLNPTADFNAGVYAEVHIGPDGKVYIVPEVARFDEHLASIEGNHSILDVPLPSRIDATSRSWWENLPLSTNTLVGKGELIKNSQGELEFKLFPFFRTRAYSRLVPEIQVNPDIDLLVKITESKTSLGINKIADLDTGKVVEVFYDPSTRPISNIDVTYKYTGNQPGFFLPDVETGYVDFLRYSFFNNPQIDANGLTRIERRDDILMNIQGTDARTHQDAVRKIFPDAPEEAIQDIITRPEIIVINDPTKQYEVLGRHTIDNKNRTVQVNLIVTSRSGEVNPDTIKDFENTFYTAYLQKLREINPMEQYELRLITSYVNGDGSVAFHNMDPIVVADFDKGLPNQSVAKLGDGTNCQIGFAAQTATLAQANQNSNVLGVSTGEVLAASTGPCGPFVEAASKLIMNLPSVLKTPIIDGAYKMDDLLIRLGARGVVRNIPTQEELEQAGSSRDLQVSNSVTLSEKNILPAGETNLAKDQSQIEETSVLSRVIQGTGGIIEGLRRKLTGADGTLSRALVPVNPDSEKLDLAIAAIKPQVESARAARKATDPEYTKRVNESLNQDRVNFLVFGYGEEHGDSYSDFGGSISIISYDLKTGKQTSISFTRDIRAPELEEMAINPQTGQKESSGIVTLREVYKRKGLEGMREIAESMTGLAVDYQIVMQDTVLKDYLSQVSGPIEVDISKQNISGPFRIGGKEYPGGFVFEAGKQTLSPDDAIRYLMAENVNPIGRIDDRAYRKAPVTEGIIKSTGNNLIRNYSDIVSSVSSGNLMQAYNQFTTSTPVQLLDFYNNQTSTGSLLLSFSPTSQAESAVVNVATKMVDKGMEGLNLTDPYFINSLLNPLTTSTVLENRAQRFVSNISNIGVTTPDKNNKNQVVVSAPGYGDSGQAGGLERLHQIWNNDQLFAGKPATNPRVQAEAIRQHEQEVKDKRGDSVGYVQVPFGGNPYSNDLINDYWRSIRCLTQTEITGVGCARIAP